MTIITDKMIEAGVNVLKGKINWPDPKYYGGASATILAVLEAALTAAPDADPLARRVDALEQVVQTIRKDLWHHQHQVIPGDEWTEIPHPMKEVLRYRAAEQRRIMAGEPVTDRDGYPIDLTPPAPDAENAAEDDRYDKLATRLLSLTIDGKPVTGDLAADIAAQIIANEIEFCLCPTAAWGGEESNG